MTVEIKLGETSTGLTRMKERGYEVRGGRWLEAFWRDCRYGARSLRKSPGFTLVAVLTLALGIGATTAIFSVMNAVLLRPLPYPDAGRLVYVGQQYRGGLAGSGEPKFLFWREQSHSFEALACYSGYGGAGGNLAGGNEAEYVRGLRVSEDFFRAIGVYPALGRAFTGEEDAPGNEGQSADRSEVRLKPAASRSVRARGFSSRALRKFQPAALRGVADFSKPACGLLTPRGSSRLRAHLSSFSYSGRGSSHPTQRHS